jgi:hypothetical protein
MSMAWDFSSSCNINPLLVKTFLTSRIVYVLSSISKASSSSFVLEFKNLMISFASVGLSPSSPMMLSMAFLFLCINSCFSNIICISGQISIMDLQMSIQIFSLASASVLAVIVLFLQFLKFMLEPLSCVHFSVVA